MKRKILLFFVTAFIFVCLLALSVSAMSGSGTEADPYVVENAEDFVSIKNSLSAYYRLDADISVSSNEGAIVEGPFTGVFDGNGHTVNVNIVGATSGTNTYDALFGVVDGNGKIKNLTVTGEITGSDKVAGVVGKLAGNANVDNCVNYAKVSGRKNIGGIAGLIYYSNSGKKATITNCVNYGSINGANPIKTGLDIGGIVGCIWETDTSIVTLANCYNAGTITAAGENCGGIVGFSQAKYFVNCFNIGTASATRGLGSIIGATDGNYTHDIKGYFNGTNLELVGAKSGTITSSGNMIESTGVAIYLGSGSGIRGEFHLNQEVYEAFLTLVGGKNAEYGAVVSTKDVVAALGGNILSKEAEESGMVIFAPAMKNGEKQYFYADPAKGEDYHSYRFALTGFPDTKQSYNLEFVILGYVKMTDKNGNDLLLCINTVKSDKLAASVDGTPYNSVNIVRVAEITISDGDYKDNEEMLGKLDYIVSKKEYGNKIEIDGITSYGHANATFTSHISSGDTVVFEINNTYSDELQEYQNDLVANGYALIMENQINGNYFYTYKKDNALIHISYYPLANEVNVASETLNNLPDNLAQPSYEKKNNSSITQIQLADNVTIKEGMSYVIHLADGTFFIIDGGWCYDDYLEADKLYDILKELAGKDNEIVIAGWIFTHCHGDHIGTFNYFVEKYHDSVTIKELLYNFPSDDDIRASASNYMLNDTKQRYNYFREMIATYLTDTEIVKVHSGYKFYYANAEIEILQTFEDLYPSTVANYDFNSSSTIFTVKIEGQKMLFVGDVTDVGASRLNKTFGNALKSDFVQIAHHGLDSSGTIKQMYMNANATYVLYPAPNEWYRSNINNDANAYINNEESIRQIFVSGLQTVELYLPYDGMLYDGERVPQPIVKTEVDRPTNTVIVPDAYFDLDMTNGVITDKAGNATINVTNGAVKETTVTHNGEEKTTTAFTKGDDGYYYMNVKFNEITTEEQMKNFIMGSTTFEIFLKLDKMPGSTVGLITSCNGGGVTLYLRKPAGGQLNFQIGSTKPNENVDSDNRYSATVDMNGSSPIAEADKLLHIVGSYDSKTNMMKLYINGMLVSQADFGSGSYCGGSGDDTVIGIGYNPQYNKNNVEAISKYADYELYEAKIYNTALTDEQVAQEYWNCIDNLLFTEAENE